MLERVWRKGNPLTLLEKEKATHSSILAWRIPRMEELGGLQSMGRKESDTTERLHFHFHLHCWWECKLVQPLWRTVWRFLKKLEIELPYDPAILLLGIHTEETGIERDTCTLTFIAALFTIAGTWKQPRCT